MSATTLILGVGWGGLAAAHQFLGGSQELAGGSDRRAQGGRPGGLRLVPETELQRDLRRRQPLDRQLFLQASAQFLERLAEHRPVQGLPG